MFQKACTFSEKMQKLVLQSSCFSVVITRKRACGGGSPRHFVEKQGRVKTLPYKRNKYKGGSRPSPTKGVGLPMGGGIAVAVFENFGKVQSIVKTGKLSGLGNGGTFAAVQKALGVA